MHQGYDNGYITSQQLCKQCMRCCVPLCLEGFRIYPYCSWLLYGNCCNDRRVPLQMKWPWLLCINVPHGCLKTDHNKTKRNRTRSVFEDPHGTFIHIVWTVLFNHECWTINDFTIRGLHHIATKRSCREQFLTPCIRMAIMIWMDAYYVCIGYCVN